MSDLQLTGEQSPFDAIRRVRADGSEFWSARDLADTMKYDQWRNFAGAVERARVSLGNQGDEPEDHIAGASKMIETGKGAQRAVDDYHLTRFGAYLTVMNGDPRKPEVAAAQAYFAIKTREAEVAYALDLSDPIAAIEAVREREGRALELAKSERSRADKAEKKLEVEQRHRRAIEGGDGIHLTDFGKKYFSEVPARKFDEHLYAKGWLINQHNTRVRADGSIRDGYDHRKPTAKGRPFIYDHDQGNYGGRRRFQPRVRPQMEIELRDRLAAEGLPVNTHSTGLVLITNDDVKELGA